MKGLAPVPGMTVQLRRENNSSFMTTLTDSTGNYLFKDMPSGTYNVIPNAVGGGSLAPVKQLVQTANPDPLNVNFAYSGPLPQSNPAPAPSPSPSPAATAANQAPIILGFSPLTDTVTIRGLHPLMTVILNVNAYDPEGSPLNYSSSLDNGQKFSSSTNVIYMNLTTQGTHIAKVFVSDGKLTSTQIWTVNFIILCLSKNSFCEGGDVNRDNKVDSLDRTTFNTQLALHVPCNVANKNCGNADIDLNGTADASDAFLFDRAYLKYA